MTKTTEIVNNETALQLNKYIEGLENYEAEKQEITDRMKEICDEAKNSGFDVKTIKKIVKLRKADKDKLQEEKYLLETYAEVVQLELF